MLERIRHAAEFHTLSTQFASIKGWLNPLEGYTLFTLASYGPGMGAIVEIGSFMGLSTCWLARGAKNARREHVTAVDHFTGSPEHQLGGKMQTDELMYEGTTIHLFREHLAKAGVEDWVETVEAASEEAVQGWDKPIRLLFIDGEHSYEATKRDFELWSPFVVPGGFVAFHDYANPHFPGVARFFDELVRSDAPLKEILGVASLKVVQLQPR